MVYLISLLGYGDNLITGSLLERSDWARENLRVIGTRVTQKVWKLLDKALAPDEILFDDVPAFYTIKNRGPVAAVTEARRFRTWALSKLTPVDTVIFESPPRFRNHLLLEGIGCTVVEIPRRRTVYLDRADIFRPYIGSHPWARAQLPSCEAKCLLINPSARSNDRTISVEVIKTILRVVAPLGTKVTLVDFQGALGELEKEVDSYMRRPLLSDAVAALRCADRYIGPDSFFMHMAYYLGIPQLALFLKKNVYFQPPGLFDQDNMIFFEDLSNDGYVERKVSRFMMANCSRVHRSVV